jgi:hypothetical protein
MIWNLEIVLKRWRNTKTGIKRRMMWNVSPSESGVGTKSFWLSRYGVKTETFAVLGCRMDIFDLYAGAMNTMPFYTKTHEMLS